MRGILDGLSRHGRWVLALAIGGWILWSWPIAAGERTFVLRDVFSTHLPFQSFAAAELGEGRIPAFDPRWANGQPFRGDPNALPFYPGNLLYLALPFWSAFGLLYVGHWLIAFLGMRRLGRELGQSPEGALVAGLAYAGSGYLLTGLTFLNLLTVAAWAPWVLAGLARGGRRGTALGALACGMMLLGGEPLTAALVVPAMAIVAIERHGLKRGATSALATGLLGLVLAAPQVVASLRVLPFTYRAAHGLPAGQVAANALHPARLLELVWPLPWGWPSDLGRFGFWAPRVTPSTPYIYSLHFGLIAFVLALVAIRTRRTWAGLAAASLAGAWALGLSGEVTSQLTFGLFRFPQKLLLPFTLAASVLAGYGVERALALPRPARIWRLASGLFGACAVAIALGREAWVRGFAEHLAAGGDERLARTQVGHWLVLASVAALLSLAAGWAAGRRSAAGLALVQWLALLPMAPIWLTDSTAPYRAESDFARALTPPRRVGYLPATFPPWEASAPLDHRTRPEQLLRDERRHLPPDFAVFDDVAQVLAPDLDGVTSPLTVLVTTGSSRADWSVRLRWLRRLGVAWIVRDSAADDLDLPVVASDASGGVTTRLLRVPDPLPELRWPARVVAASSPIEAWLLVARGEIDDDVAVASRPIAHAAGGHVARVAGDADGVVFNVDSPGGLVVWQRAYWPIYRARLEDGRRLPTLPADVALLGVEVPAGRHRVTIDVASWPEIAAGVLAVAMALALGAVAWRAK